MVILDHNGRPLEKTVLTEPQTSRVSQLHQAFATHPSRGLTPSKLASILEDAERGDLSAQADLYEDMEEKDAHIFAEMQKRKNALLTVSWDIVAPDNASAAEKKATETAKELVKEIPDFEDVLLDLLDGIGKGYSCQEIEWARAGKSWLPRTVEWRPPSWFQVSQEAQNELRLRDGSATGALLQPFGWVVHKHKAKSGYVTRAGLHRVLAWPYIFKNYSVRDLAEFLEIYGLPVRLGKYPSGAGDREKATLMRAVVGIGHNAGGIIPSGMEIELMEAAKGTHEPFQAMLDWTERSQSKAILGQTLSAEAKPTGLGSGVANVHNEVRRDILVSDARQAASTLTRDLIYPIVALNTAGIEGFRRSPRLVFDTKQPEDLKAFSESLPPLVNSGLRVPKKWVHEKLCIPVPSDDDEVLEPSAPATPASPFGALKDLRALRGVVAAATSLTREQTDNRDAQQALVDAAESLSADWRAIIGKRVEDLIAMLEETKDLQLFRDRLAELLDGDPPPDVVEVLARAGFTAHALGRVQK